MNLRKRILEISHKYKLSHIGSCLTSVDIIDHIYKVKKKKEPFILSNGHAGLALYVVLEKHEGKDAEALWVNHGTHPSRSSQDGICCSTGSLGQGLTVAVGMALANSKRNVYVLTSDGEMAEGSCWEALRIAADLRLENLRISVVANGLSAYGKVDVDLLDLRMQYFYPSLVVKTDLFSYPEWLQGLAGHYVVMDDKQYKSLGEISSLVPAKKVKNEKTR
jgi:transketolase